MRLRKDGEEGKNPSEMGECVGEKTSSQNLSGQVVTTTQPFQLTQRFLNIP
jgi:hypothetical protein